MNKKERLEKIRRLVTDYQIGTQEEIVEHLKEAGITATQATVSRAIISQTTKNLVCKSSVNRYFCRQDF